MIFTQSNLRQSVRILQKIINYSTASSNNANTDFHFKPKFSDEEQEKILSTLNETDAEQLQRFDVSRTRLKNLENWKVKNGRFRSLSEILEVEGLGEKVLQRLCNSILLHKPIDSANNNINAIKTNQNHRLRQILLPPLCPNLAQVMKSAVGIHLATTGISWVKLSTDKNELLRWGFQDFVNLPKKMLPTETFDLAKKLMLELPVGDVYVMESNQSMNQTSNKPTAPTYTQQLELTSMLLALINTSKEHNPKLDGSYNADNRTYYLRSNLPPRLFQTFIGNERVSTAGIVTQLLERSNELSCTKINSSNDIKQYYNEQVPAYKEILGQVLLLAITFVDLCIYKNPVSHKAISPGRR